MKNLRIRVGNNKKNMNEELNVMNNYYRKFWISNCTLLQQKRERESGKKNKNGKLKINV